MKLLEIVKGGLRKWGISVTGALLGKQESLKQER